ncbi:hypothetical protein EYF80_010446 [Liparis tanakae]|uniref:Uncharacterized protein n=1 Tax=Liparis tanakae TaxID=230148 RepID=A0A4Z2IPR4_9TELE|nr:hypothetical protein EYF80_010446 [Liparis tanakae]
MSAKSPILMICHSRPSTRWGFPSFRSKAPMLTTWQPMAEAEFRARFRFSCKVQSSQLAEECVRLGRPSLAYRGCVDKRSSAALTDDANSGWQLPVGVRSFPNPSAQKKQMETNYVLCVLVGTGPSSPSRLAGDVGVEGQGGPYSPGLGLSGVLRGVQSSAGGLGRRVS